MQIDWSAARGDTQTVERLLKKGVSVDQRDHPNSFVEVERQKGLTPLMCACRSRHAGVDMARFLISRGADVNASGEEYGEVTALWLAAKAGHLQKVEALLDGGANIRYRNPSGYNVLVEAVHGVPSSYRQMVQLLISKGAELNSITEYGESGLSVASR